MSIQPFVEPGDNIGKYTLTSEFEISGGGGEHGIGERGGKKYHLKVPDDCRDDGSPDAHKMHNDFIEAWKSKISRLKVLGSLSGDIIIPIEVFSYRPKPDLPLYPVVVSPFVDGLIDKKDVKELSRQDKLDYMAHAAYQVMRLHSAGLVHSDIKLPNLPPCRKSKGTGACLLDFDGSYDVGNPPENLVCDFVCMSPEALLRSNKGDVIPGQASDIFSLAVTFAGIWAGRFKPVDKLRYVAEVVLNLDNYEAILENWLKTSDDMPEDLTRLLLTMLNRDPDQRPMASDIYKHLLKIKENKPVASITASKSDALHPDGAAIAEEAAVPTSATSSTEDADFEGFSFTDAPGRAEKTPDVPAPAHPESAPASSISKDSSADCAEEGFSFSGGLSSLSESRASASSTLPHKADDTSPGSSSAEGSVPEKGHEASNKVSDESDDISFIGFDNFKK